MLYSELMKKLSCPEYVALDLRYPLLRFYKEVSLVTCLPQQTMSCILYELIRGIRRDECADFDIQMVVVGLYEEELGIEGIDEADVEHMVRTTMDLANALIEHVRGMNVYVGGLLHYRFYCWLDPFTPVLEKYIETDAFQER